MTNLRAQHIAKLIAEYFGPNTIEIEGNIVTIVDPTIGSSLSASIRAVNDRFMITVAPTFPSTDHSSTLPNPEE